MLGVIMRVRRDADVNQDVCSRLPTYQHKTCLRKPRPGLVYPVQLRMHGGVGAGICPPTNCYQGLQVGVYDTIAFKGGAGLGAIGKIKM